MTESIGGGGAASSEWTVDGNGNLTPEDGEPVTVDDATINEQIQVPSDPFQIYVDATNGSDTNTGLSESEALATVGEALNRVPNIGVHTVEIRLTDETHAVHEGIIKPWAWRVKFRPVSGTSGTPILESSHSKNAFWVENCFADFDDVDIRPADESNPYENTINIDDARVRFSGSGTFVGGTNAVVQTIRRGSGLFEAIDSVTLKNASGASNATGIVTYGRSFARILQNVTVDGFARAGWADRGSALFFAGTAQNVDVGLLAQDGAAAKASGSAVISATTAFAPEHGGQIVKDGADTSGSTNILPDTFTGSYQNTASGRKIEQGMEVVHDATYSVSTGSQVNASLNKSQYVDLGDSLEATATPANAPGNAHGYETQLRWTGSEIRVTVSETVDSGGGDARTVVKKDWSQ